MEYKGIQQTDKKRTFGTGSVRGNAEGKGRPDLIPTLPLMRLAQHCEHGTFVYGDRNWELGQPINEFYNSAFRHLTAWMNGEDQEDHLTLPAELLIDKKS